MSVLDHARTGAPAGYDSRNHAKWRHPNALYQRHLEMYLDRMYDYVQRTGARNILDAGCGEGIVYRAMRERGYNGRWTGFDFSREAVDFARVAAPEAEWHHASAYEIPFPDGSFDLVFSSQVLEHLPEPHRPLREYARVSAGWLLLSVPLEPYFRTMEKILLWLRLGGDPGHVNHWSPRRFREFAMQAGRLEAWDWTTVYQIALIKLPQNGKESAAQAE